MESATPAQIGSRGAAADWRGRDGGGGVSGGTPPPFLEGAPLIFGVGNAVARSGMRL